MRQNDLSIYNSVTLDPLRCNGCINCMKRCPTEAIRVRDGKAKIDKDACIGCGECIRICRSKAKIPAFDSLSALETSGFKYKIALPGPSLYAQFNNLGNIDIVLSGLKAIGFDDVFETALGNEAATRATNLLLAESAENGAARPLITSACPAVLKLILYRYEGLIENVSPVMAPEEIAARMAREEAVKKTGLNDGDIGVFFISPCSANVCSLKAGTAKNYIDYVLSQGEVYFKLLSVMPKIADPEPMTRAGRLGLSWAVVGGEAKAVCRDKFLAADGIENVINILDALDDGRLPDLDFIELAACPGGCVGGVLNVENPFMARSKIQRLKKITPDKPHGVPDTGTRRFIHTEQYSPAGIYKLSDDRAEAMKKLMEINRIHSALPGLDCGSCGAPSCRAFAEDVARGLSEIKCVRQKKNDRK